ncbi:TRAP transporter small permease [Bacillus canaveralius]|uniref:TRAP transporter small permease n=1 Tax=Bacillus canaveralius TaxID=1403243 RepID=A0A2N5GK05_9BACI|nr:MULTISPECIES: TRAP transporter small permease [Bacillus]PLR81661.1 TRAP transporter small permease [Bacillus canaveralius]PLR87727.1 TRAP transporter small permease [Bacillus sp. V33-4]PLR89875.1 TRAP transporter small permease [Bacillus canaveralius]
MSKVLKVLNGILNSVIVIILVGMVGLVFINVVLRYAFDSGITWSEELSRYLFVWLVFLGAVVAARDKSHLGVDILTANVPRKVQKVLSLVANTLVIFVLILFIDGLFKMINLNSMISGPATGIPVAFFYLAGVVFAVLMIAITAIQTIQFIFSKDGEPPLTGEPEIEGRNNK